MISGRCECGQAFSVPEAQANKLFACETCQRKLLPVAAEQLADGQGEGDFDSRLILVGGPAGVGSQIFLGGVVDIEIGKLAGKPIQLVGAQVSRNHAKLVRVDFGPSRWKVVDNKSTNGLFVNGTKVQEQELQEGDTITVGDFDLKYRVGVTEEAPLEEAVAAGASSMAKGSSSKATAAAYVPPGGPVCPSCEQALAPGAKFCIPCGINVETGRPLITASEMDENVLYGNAETWIRWISILVPVTPLPIPIRSEAVGNTRPYAIWTIAATTVLASVLFFIVQLGDRHGESKNLMLWSPYAKAGNLAANIKLSPRTIQRLMERMNDEEDAEYQQAKQELRGKVPEDEVDEKAFYLMLEKELAARRGEFHWYQLITHAFLHDTSGPLAFVMHLGGNLLFMLVFGTRVNSLIGNVATAIIYPILAVAAAMVHLYAEGSHALGAMVGASGAIMGLAGMYLILFPIQQVYCAMWIRIWLRFRTYFGCKIFALRGFWVLLIYFAYDILMNMIPTGPGGGGVAHWAHIGGFTTGILLSRQINCRGNDILSVAMGKGAWALIGKPSRWRNDLPPTGVTERAVSLNYPG